MVLQRNQATMDANDERLSMNYKVAQATDNFDRQYEKAKKHDSIARVIILHYLCPTLFYNEAQKSGAFDSIELEEFEKGKCSNFYWVFSYRSHAEVEKFILAMAGKYGRFDDYVLIDKATGKVAYHPKVEDEAFGDDTERKTETSPSANDSELDDPFADE